jgi:hypothetical protein
MNRHERGIHREHAEAEMSGDGELRVLDREQVEAYERDGFLFPIPLFDVDQANRWRTSLEAIEAAEVERGGGVWHERSRSIRDPPEHPLGDWVEEIVRNPRILDLAEDLIGENLLVRNVDLFVKDGQSNNGIGWHVDSNFNGIALKGVLNIWIALTTSYDGNGGVWFAPGSHMRPAVPDGKEEDFTAAAESTADHRQVVLAPGEVSIHHHRVLHRSRRNPTKERRIGVAVRYMSTEMDPEVACSGAGMVVRGSATGGRYSYGEHSSTPFTWWKSIPRSPSAMDHEVAQEQRGRDLNPMGRGPKGPA